MIWITLAPADTPSGLEPKRNQGVLAVIGNLQHEGARGAGNHEDDLPRLGRILRDDLVE